MSSDTPTAAATTRAGYEKDGSDRTTIRWNAEGNGWSLMRATESGDLFEHPDKDGIQIVAQYGPDPERYGLHRKLIQAGLQSEVGTHAMAYVSREEDRPVQMRHCLSWFGGN